MSGTDARFYIPRKLNDGEKVYSEDQLLKVPKHIVLLAEPGAGKTQVLESLAKQSGGVIYTANKFRRLNNLAVETPLILDGFDELSRLDNQAPSELFARAAESGAEQIVLSSRSSEWNQSYIHQFKDLLGDPPLVVRLEQFTETEIRQLFEHSTPKANYEEFIRKVREIDLDHLIANPQFLELFAIAFSENAGAFNSKCAAFKLATEKLTRESNEAIPPTASLPAVEKLSYAGEIFCILLLSGCDGISIDEVNANRSFPSQACLDASLVSNHFLDSKLFRPGVHSSLHLPVHRVVAEYCAAKHLVERVSAPTDQLDLDACLAIIAPNSIVRVELRGLVAWMACLALPSDQEAIINLDPYAVLAGGDPSQLSDRMRVHLLQCLRKAADIDPQFRGADGWRKFSVGDFFSSACAPVVQEILLDANEAVELKGLIMSLLENQGEGHRFERELSEILLSSTDKYLRLSAVRCFASIEVSLVTTLCDELVQKGGDDSLYIAGELLIYTSTSLQDEDLLEHFLSAIAELITPPGFYTTDEAESARRLFDYAATLDLKVVESLLNKYCAGLKCTCSEERYFCQCKWRHSHIIASLLDRYIAIAEGELDSTKLWTWLKDLDFAASRSGTEWRLTALLQEDEELRRSIFRLAFTDYCKADKAVKKRLFFRGITNGHPGLSYADGDREFVTDLAFENDEVAFWASFIPNHYSGQKQPGEADPIRHAMRLQSRQKPEFAAAWSKQQRASKQQLRSPSSHIVRQRRWNKKRRLKENGAKKQNYNFLQNNRTQIERGEHYGLLRQFSGLLLSEPENLIERFGDEDLAKTSLRNCLPFLAPYVPKLKDAANMETSGTFSYIGQILYAHCILRVRERASFDGIPEHALLYLYSDLNWSHAAITEVEAEQLKTKIEEIIFPDESSKEAYLRSYFEPQLEQYAHKQRHLGVSTLAYNPIFGNQLKSLPLEWLEKYESLSITVTDDLFKMAVRHGDRDRLQRLITTRCQQWHLFWPGNTPIHDRHDLKTYWFLRAVYFLEAVPEFCWQLLSKDKASALNFYQIWHRHDVGRREDWPTLTSIKVERILTIFVPMWPVVKLKSSWGTGIGDVQNVNRFFDSCCWMIVQDEPTAAFPVVDRLLGNAQLSHFHQTLKSIRARQIKEHAFADFEPPEPEVLIKALNHDMSATVEGLRKLVVKELARYQADLKASETTSRDVFYDGEKGLREVAATRLVADRLRIVLGPYGIITTPEHELVQRGRVDITFTKLINEQKRVIVLEAKGQWHTELFKAATKQMLGRYAKHPAAENQGIYLVFWFGANEKVAGKKTHEFASAAQLQSHIVETLPLEIKGHLDVVVLDVSRLHEEQG